MKSISAMLRGVMQKRGWMPVLALIWLTAAAPAFCQSSFAEEAITAEEYEIYRLVLGGPLDASAVDRETLEGIRADADWLIPPAGIRLAPDLVKAFNTINAKKYMLSIGFLPETTSDAGGGREGRKKTTFSRVGFDPQKIQALLMVATTWYYPEDVMNEGAFVLLEKKSGKWQVVDTARAWNMRLGPVH